ncbi:MAG: hypothetical protein FWB96_11330 [Defluviitaleaceae bacterium]|nr:hypothetical protein [Defluviitaleaceae bacterium]MCL2263628.1 hypothetical protein [Defluviitaleaceae bacterium]
MTRTREHAPEYENRGLWKDFIFAARHDININMNHAIDNDIILIYHTVVAQPIAQTEGASEMTNENSKYFSGLLNKASKKQVAVYFDSKSLDEIDMTVKQFSQIGTSSFARNTLIEEAVQKYLVDAKKFLLDEHTIDVDALIEIERGKKFDTVILSCNNEGSFRDVFIDSQCWWPCRISEDRESHLEFIALYRGGDGSPSAITHYAAIKEFKLEKVNNEKAKVCYFKEPPKELPNKITIGNKDGVFFRGAKYVKLDNLLKITKADDIMI